MLIDARRLEAGAALKAEVCIVGAGAAGITLARELAAAQIDVILLESGGDAYDEGTQALYDGPVGGGILRIEDNYLKGSRLRFLGGSTNHWDGWCRPLDPIDFERREWVPLSGWPIARATLEPYYRRACEHVQIRAFDYDPRTFERGGDVFLFPPGAQIESSVFHVSPPTRFGVQYRQELVDSRHVRLCTWANVVEIETDEAGAAVERVRVATLGGACVTVEAAAFVLATGAIEVPRLLLASNRVQKAGLGNQNDMVGRCFMEHPVFPKAGYMVLPRRRSALGLYGVARRPGFDHRTQALLFVSPQAQRERGLLNTIFGPHLGKAPYLAGEVTDLATAIDRLHAPAAPPPEQADYYGKVTMISEQAPSRESRVTLTAEKDELGVPRVRLDWRLGEIERRSLRAAIELLATELGRHALGRASFVIDPELPWKGASISNHHMGTTRMSSAPPDGVVDPDLRVHGIANLYVASSAVFPTSGVSNPTLTIVALTVRLADHLKGRIG